MKTKKEFLVYHTSGFPAERLAISDIDARSSIVISAVVQDRISAPHHLISWI